MPSPSISSHAARGRLVGLLAVLGFACPTSAWALHEVNPNEILTYPCYIGRPDYNAKRCGRSRDKAEQYCATQMTQVTPAFLDAKSSYVAGSRVDYKVSFMAPDPGGCWPGGKQFLRVVQQRRQGAEGTFVNSSEVYNVPMVKYRKAEHPFRVTVVIKAPYDCSTMAPGSAVHATVTVGWVPKPHWAPHAKTKQVSLAGPVENIC